MKGIAAYIELANDNETRVVFQDLSSNQSAAPQSWQVSAPYTSNLYNSAALENLQLTQEQYAQIGQNLVLRLLALNGKIK